MKRPLTQRDLAGPGVLIGREGEIVHALRDVLRQIADTEPQPMNTSAWNLVLLARDAVGPFPMPPKQQATRSPYDMNGLKEFPGD